MENVPVPQAILKLSIPTVLSMIVSILYNLTDTYFIGLLDDSVQLGAISLAFPVFVIIQAVGNIFGNGAPSYISRSLGAKKYDEVRRTSAVSIYVSLLITAIMTMVCFIFMKPILRFLGTSTDTVAPTESYLKIVVGFSMILALQIILPALLRSEGRVKEAVIGMMLGTVLNIVLDPIFIIVLKQGVAGAAWATVIGNFLLKREHLTFCSTTGFQTQHSNIGRGFKNWSSHICLTNRHELCKHHFEQFGCGLWRLCHLCLWCFRKINHYGTHDHRRVCVWLHAFCGIQLWRWKHQTVDFSNKIRYVVWNVRLSTPINSFSLACSGFYENVHF